MSNRVTSVLLGLVIAALMAPAAFAEKPPWAGGGRGGGGNPGTADIYGDMVLIDRDANGVPITTYGVGPQDVWGQVPQPIMLAPKATAADCPLWYVGGVPSEELVPVDGNSIYYTLGIEAYRLPFDEVLGEIPEAYLGCATEADFGRLSSARSPDEVIDHALAEMVATLAAADAAGGQILLDAAGRVMVRYDSFDEYNEPITIEKTIDAPLENLAGFERILESASISHQPEGDFTAAVPKWPGHGDLGMDLLDRAAAMLGAAGDKAGYIGLDEVVYLTQIRTIVTDMLTEASNAFGKPLPEGYFNFSKFTYDRSATFAGDVCYLKITDPSPVPEPVVGTTTLPFTVTGVIVKESILPLVFPPLDDSALYIAGFEEATDEDGKAYTNFVGTAANDAGGVWAFARAADDTRAVINWMHDHPVPIELASYCDLEMTE